MQICLSLNLPLQVKRSFNTIFISLRNRLGSLQVNLNWNFFFFFQLFAFLKSRFHIFADFSSYVKFLHPKEGLCGWGVSQPHRCTARPLYLEQIKSAPSKIFVHLNVSWGIIGQAENSKVEQRDFINTKKSTESEKNLNCPRVSQCFTLDT